MINTIISSSLLILIILAIRFVFRGKINPMVQYGLWSLVAFRLVTFNWLNLYPLESVLSVMNIADKATETIRGASAVDQVITGNAEAGTIDNVVLIMDNIKTGVMISGDGISAAASIDWQLVIMIIWSVGTITLGLWLIYVNQKFGKKLYNDRRFLMSVVADNNHSDANSKYLSVYIVDWLQSPCLMRYKGEDAIYVAPEVASDKEKLRYATTHELCHYRHHDLIWSAVRVGLLAFYWFNPLVWLAAVISKKDCELACDYGVIKKIGDKDRLIYGKTLVDLISDREHKTNVLSMATTMYGSARDIKGRINMIARNNKMKKTTLIAILLIAALSVGCTFTSASSNNISEPNGEAMAEIEDFSIKWADAYSERDANTIYELCENEELFFTIGDVAENGEYWMGMSSPWPWNKDYVIEIVDSSTIEIYYYFRTSTPSISVAKETITIEKVGDEYKAVKEVRKHFDTIDSKADFEEAYKHGLPDFTEFAAAYQFQADDDSLGRKEILEDPVAGAIEQLNLVGAKVTSIYQDPYVNKAVTKLAWDDGEVTINSIQPILTDEDGSNRQATIWIVVNEDDPEALLFNKERTTY